MYLDRKNKKLSFRKFFIFVFKVLERKKDHCKLLPFSVFSGVKTTIFQSISLSNEMPDSAKKLVVEVTGCRAHFAKTELTKNLKKKFIPTVSQFILPVTLPGSFASI